MKIRRYRFQSCFVPYLERFLQEKRSVGFLYESEEWKLKHFDAFCMEEKVTEPRLNRELVQKWGTLRDRETFATCSARISILRQFALFLAPLACAKK